MGKRFVSALRKGDAFLYMGRTFVVTCDAAKEWFEVVSGKRMVSVTAVLSSEAGLPEAELVRVERPFSFDYDRKVTVA